MPWESISKWRLKPPLLQTPQAKQARCEFVGYCISVVAFPAIAVIGVVSIAARVFHIRPLQVA
jgi:hypothetical protein